MFGWMVRRLLRPFGGTGSVVQVSYRKVTVYGKVDSRPTTYGRVDSRPTVYGK